MRGSQGGKGSRRRPQLTEYASEQGSGRVSGRASDLHRFAPCPGAPARQPALMGQLVFRAGDCGSMVRSAANCPPTLIDDDHVSCAWSLLGGLISPRP